MRNKIYILLVLLFFVGCSTKQNIINIDHYSIGFNSTISLNKKIDNTILIDEVNVNNAFNSRSIFYTQKEYSFEEYLKNKWINFPSFMMHNQLIDSFNSSKIFKSVLVKKSKLEFDYMLKTDVIKLFHSVEKDKSYAILKIKFDLIRDNKVNKTFSYNKKVLCESTDAYGFVKALNKAFEEVINDLLLKL